MVARASGRFASLVVIGAALGSGVAAGFLRRGSWPVALVAFAAAVVIGLLALRRASIRTPAPSFRTTALYSAATTGGLLAAGFFRHGWWIVGAAALALACGLATYLADLHSRRRADRPAGGGVRVRRMR